MKKVLIFAAFAAAILNSAWIVEGADSNCAAVERLALRQVVKKDEKLATSAMAASLIGLSNGRFAAMKAAQVSSFPTPIVCLSLYWQHVGEPER
jgi:hypothetical protein